MREWQTDACFPFILWWSNCKRYIIPRYVREVVSPASGTSLIIYKRYLKINRRSSFHVRNTSGNRCLHQARGDFRVCRNWLCQWTYNFLYFLFFFFFMNSFKSSLCPVIFKGTLSQNTGRHVFRTDTFQTARKERLQTALSELVSRNICSRNFISRAVCIQLENRSSAVWAERPRAQTNIFSTKYTMR